MITGPEKLISLRKDQLGPASRMLARAFWDDTTSLLAYPQEQDRRARMHYLFEFLLRLYFDDVQMYTTSENLEGISIWRRYDSQKPGPSLWQLFRSGAIWPALKMGLKAAKRMEPFTEYVEKKHRELPPYPHWYLMVLGVDPDFQGKGYASRLVQPVLARADTQGLPCYLETAKEKNVAMYRHFGFQVVEDFIVPGTAVKLWAMLHPAHRPQV